jgi:choline dehydrogenase
VNPADMHRSSGAAMFEASRNRTNLVVFGFTQATKIIMDSNKTATGIMANDINNQSFPLMAMKEVIVAAGTFRSPQLLMVSGIGSAAMLKNFSIPVVQDLAGVGQNLVDSPFVGQVHQLNFNTSNQFFVQSVADLNNNTLFPQGKGILTDALDLTSFEGVPPEFNSSLSVNTKKGLEAFPPDWPPFAYLPVNSDLSIFRTVESRPPGNQTSGPNYGSLTCAVSTPFSRGSVTLYSANGADQPKVDIGYLNDERDIDLLTIAFKRGRQVWNAPAMKPALIGKEYWPGLDLVPNDDDTAIRNHIIQNVMPIWEAVGTCAMGQSNDTKAVVDSNGRVFGVNSLRIADASTIPFTLPGHPASSVFAIAERMADKMKQEWK